MQTLIVTQKHSPRGTWYGVRAHNGQRWRHVGSYAVMPSGNILVSTLDHADLESECDAVAALAEWAGIERYEVVRW